MRNAYGNIYSQTEMPAARLGDADDSLWNGEVFDWLAVGADLRAGYNYVDTPNQEETSEFDITRGTIYVEARLIDDRLALYVDQQISPGSSLNREAYLKLYTASRKFHLLAGQFFLPFGLRLQDDTAFTRLATGVNFNNPDRGVQAGYERGPWSTQFSISNGSGGVGETDTGKLVSGNVVYTGGAWRIGVSAAANDADVGDRTMLGAYAGIRTGPFAWLAELDYVTDDLPGGGDTTGVAGIAEANWRPAQGHNVKITYDFFDPDDDAGNDEQTRFSALWEYAPIQFLQLRAGARLYDGVAQVDAQNREEYFIELHGFF